MNAGNAPNTGISHPMNFLERHWMDLPPTARVTSYFIILLATIYWIFGVQFVDAKLQVKYEGESYPARGALLIVETSGRLLRIQPDNDGFFSFPLPSRWPFKNIVIDFIVDVPKNDHILHKLEWSSAYKDRVFLTYNRQDRKITKDEPSTFDPNVGSLVFNNAYAENEQLIKNNGIESDILELIKNLSGRPIDRNNYNFKLIKDLDFGSPELSIISGKIKKQYGVDLWPILQLDPSINEIINASRQSYYDDHSNSTWLGDRLLASREQNQKAEIEISQKDLPIFSKARFLRKSNSITDKKESVKELAKLSKNYPDSAYIIHFNLALAYSDLGDIGNAKQSYEKAIQIAESKKIKDDALWNTYGRFLYRNGDCGSALKYYNKVKEKTPERTYLASYIDDANKCIINVKAK